MSDTDLTLANCAAEPIHIPGSIQPHGALFAFSAQRLLVAWSANCFDLTGVQPSLGAELASLNLPLDAVELIYQAGDDLDAGEAMPSACEVTIGDEEFDCIVHAHDGRIIAEFERRALSSDVVASFALKAHGAIDRLKRQQSVDALLNMVVQQVRQLTGFDRVMAYRFRHDDSGDVVAEACSEAVEAYLGRRYPASDIPAQARRLYLINTLRLISDVGYTPVPVLGCEGDAPLDMSHGVLRSVSPIHIEYLQNMGVHASMSISIVVGGRLWGMLACHHMAPRQVPYSIRMAADVLAQVLASSVQTLEARGHAAGIERAAELGSRVLEAMSHEDQVLRALGDHAPELCEALQADALVVAQHGEFVIHGAIEPELVREILASIADVGEVLFQRTEVADWPEDLQAQLGKWVGMLVMSYDASSQGMLLALRTEQVEAVRWAGKPEKIVALGPLGPRLTPRGSFDEWCETVRGRAVPWDATSLTIASGLLSKISRAVAARNAEIDRARTELMAMLGHDLRDPLQAINMAGALLERGSQSQTIGRRIQSSSNRMQRLIGHVLDMSRINGGIGLGMQLAQTDLRAMLADLVEELGAAHPGASFRLEAPAPVSAMVDPDRLVQVMTNLLSNARHHGEAGKPVTISLRAEGAEAVIGVRNYGAPIPDAVADKLFDPFKHTSLNNPRNRKGVGLGLYIAHQIARGHGGTLAYHYDEPEIVFTLRLPLGH